MRLVANIPMPGECGAGSMSFRQTSFLLIRARAGRFARGSSLLWQASKAKNDSVAILCKTFWDIQAPKGAKNWRQVRLRRPVFVLRTLRHPTSRGTIASTIT